MEYPASEQKAIDFVNSIGLTRAYRLIDLIGNRASRRERKLPAFMGGNFNVLNEWETDLFFQLKMGVQILDTYNTPYEAKKRILQRIADRKARILKAKRGCAHA